MKFKFSLLFILGFAFCMNAQTTFQPKQIEMDWKGVIYKKENTFDIRIHSHGYALAANFGKLKTYYKTQYYQIELGLLKNERERRQNRNYSSQIFGNSTAFVYGKQNSLYTLRAGYGIKKYLSEKARRKGIAVGFTYEIGPVLGILKPYYLNIEVKDDPIGLNGEIEEIKYTEETADLFLNFNSIYGASPFLVGIREVKLVPGIQAKAGMHFAVGAFEKYVKAIEAGIMLDLFSQSMPIMVETDLNKNKPFFLNLYVNLHFGKRE